MKRKNLLKLIIGVTVVAALAIALPLAGGCAPKPAAPEPTPTPEEPIPTPEEPTPAPEPAEEVPVITWRCVGVTPPQENNTHIRPWLDSLEEMSGGRWKFELFQYGELMPPDQLISAMIDGRIDFVYGCDLDMAPPVDVLNLSCIVPFMNQSSTEAYAIFQKRGVEKLFQEAYEEQVPGVKFLHMITADPNNILSTEPIYGLEDFDGLKINTFASVIACLEPEGAVSIRLPVEEFYLGAQTGVVDALSWGGAYEGVGNGWYEVLPYFMGSFMPGACSPGTWCSTESWNALPPDMQAILTYGLNDLAMRGQLYYYEGELKSRPYFQEVTFLPPEDLAKLRQNAFKYWDEEIAPTSPRCAEIVQIIKDYNEEVEAQKWYR